MQSPYESALRVQRRTLDSIRLLLLAELAREQVVETHLAALETDVAHETTVAASDWNLTAHPYRQRQRAVKTDLQKNKSAIDASLMLLRGATMEACGEMQAIVEASASFIADHTKREALSAQAQADDFAGTRFAASRRSLAMARR